MVFSILGDPSYWSLDFSVELQDRYSQQCPVPAVACCLGNLVSSVFIFLSATTLFLLELATTLVTLVILPRFNVYFSVLPSTI